MTLVCCEFVVIPKQSLLLGHRNTKSKLCLIHSSTALNMRVQAFDIYRGDRKVNNT